MRRRKLPCHLSKRTTRFLRARRLLEATARADLDAMDEMMAPSSPTAA